jgi:hypothetical protein
MTALRSALILVLSLGSTAVFADQITCESHGGRAEACGTVDPGSSVQLVEQISSSPCIEGSTWGADNDSIWVSGGCRAVFDVQPRYSSRSDTYYDDSRNDRPRSSRAYASDNTGRRIANNACVNRITTDQPFGYDEISTNDVRRVSDDLFVVEMNTPKGPVSCSVDRSGTVHSIDYR